MKKEILNKSGMSISNLECGYEGLISLFKWGSEFSLRTLDSIMIFGTNVGQYKYKDIANELVGRVKDLQKMQEFPEEIWTGVVWFTKDKCTISVHKPKLYGMWNEKVREIIQKHFPEVKVNIV